MNCAGYNFYIKNWEKIVIGVKISAVTIGNIEIDAFKKIDGIEIFKVTDRKSCDEILAKVSNDDVVFIISDGREVYYAEKFS